MVILPVIFCAVVFALSAPAGQTRTDSLGALTNWQAALNCFQKAGGSIGENKLDQARSELAAATTNLAPPYSTLAAQFATRLAAAVAISPDLKDPRRLGAMVALCNDLRAYDAALRLQSAEELADDRTYAWRLFEVGDTQAALTEYKRKLVRETVDTFTDYYQEQIRLLERRATNLTNVQFSLELVREHYLKGYEQQVDSLSAIQELNRALPYALHATQAVALVQSIIARLSDLRDESGRNAWEEKLLNDFKNERGACANVYLERGLRAHDRKDYPQALALFHRVRFEYADTLAYGDGQYAVGLVLQEQGKFDEAVEEYRKIFSSHVRDYDLDLKKSDDCKNYRHHAALRVSECYAAKKDFAQALFYAEQARDRYVYVSFCKRCIQESKESLETRINELRASAKSQPSAQNIK